MTSWPYAKPYLYRGDPALLEANARIRAWQDGTEKPPRLKGQPTSHGSLRAYRRHLKDGTVPCGMCLHAKAKARQRERDSQRERNRKQAVA